MNLTKIFVGVDISKDSLDVHLLPEKKYFRVQNDTSGLQKLMQNLSEYTVARIVCEASGGYETLLIRTLSQANYPIWLIEPKRIKAFIASEGIKAKTDKIDAAMIALFAQQKELSEQTRIKVSKLNEELLKELVKYKNNLTGIAAQEKTRMNHPQAIFCKEKMQQHIAFLNEQIEKVEKEIEQLIKSDDDWQQKQTIITSMPGAGKSTASALIAFMPELGKIGNKQAAALAGLVPYTKESGTYTKTATIREGRPLPRKALYMSALSAIQHNQDFKIFYNRLRESGKKPKVAIVAVMRKFIVLANVLLTENRTWTISKNIYTA
jgi:transposase